MSDEKKSQGKRLSRGEAVTLLAALIGVVGAIVAAIIVTADTSNPSTDTVLRIVPTQPSGTPPPTTGVEKEPPAEKEMPYVATTPCLPSKSSSSDGSMGTARGPLKSGHRYTGIILAEDEDWLGFCVSRDGRVDISFENSCSSSEGPNDIYADLVTPGEVGESHYLHPPPGQLESRPIEAKAETPHFVHIYDLEESDIGSDVCSELPWALTVTGPLTSVIKVGTD